MSLVASPSRTVSSLVIFLILVSLACSAPGLGGGLEEEPVPKMESVDPIREPSTPPEEAVVEGPASLPQSEEQTVEDTVAEAVSEPAAQSAYG